MPKMGSTRMIAPAGGSPTRLLGHAVRNVALVQHGFGGSALPANAAAGATASALEAPI
jgi:hypothetical protein